MIMAYKTYGTRHSLSVAGRVLQDEGFAPARDTHARLRNLLEFYKRLESDEVPGARLACRFGDTKQELVADGEGYFQGDIALAQPLQSGGWHAVDLELLAPLPARGKKQPAPRARAAVLVPGAEAQLGIISDIDDTVLQSHVARKLRMLLVAALSNARTRKPFAGVAAFYRALTRGPGGAARNPVFYVSSSPWNLYAPLVEFLDTQGIPPGPLLLRDFSARALLGAAGHHGHKLAAIERILSTYPHLPFALIGDTTEQDPEIYAEVVRRHPRRIRVIYIRSMAPDATRLQAIAALMDEVRGLQTQLVLAPDSEFAAAHAAGEGLISAADWVGVRESKGLDQAAPTAAALARKPVG
jgi:phosphatidate phosphatase APP1